MYFDQPQRCDQIHLYLTAVEGSLEYADFNTFHIELIDVDNVTHPLHRHALMVDCQDYPIVVNTRHAVHRIEKLIKGESDVYKIIVKAT